MCLFDPKLFRHMNFVPCVSLRHFLDFITFASSAAFLVRIVLIFSCTWPSVSLGKLISCAVSCGAFSRGGFVSVVLGCLPQAPKFRNKISYQWCVIVDPPPPFKNNSGLNLKRTIEKETGQQTGGAPLVHRGGTCSDTIIHIICDLCYMPRGGEFSSNLFVTITTVYA
jgi:hypothetical protein